MEQMKKSDFNGSCCLGKTAGDEFNGAVGVVVGGNGICNVCGILVGVADGHNGNVHNFGFLYSFGVVMSVQQDEEIGEKFVVAQHLGRVGECAANPPTVDVKLITIHGAFVGQSLDWI